MISSLYQQSHTSLPVNKWKSSAKCWAAGSRANPHNIPQTDSVCGRRGEATAAAWFGAVRSTIMRTGCAARIGTTGILRIVMIISVFGLCAARNHDNDPHDAGCLWMTGPIWIMTGFLLQQFSVVSGECSNKRGCGRPGRHAEREVAADILR